MAFRRACTYAVNITPPETPATYSNALVTFKQDNVVINKGIADLTIDGGDFVVNLTQEETALFTAGKRAWLQMRLFASATNAPGSPEYPIDVLPVLNDAILAAPTE